MLDITRGLIRDIARRDPSITPEMLKAGLAAFDGESVAVQIDRAPLDRIVSRAEVAQVLGVTVRTVTAYAKRGLLRGICAGAQGARRGGYLLSSVRQLMDSGSGAATAADSDGGAAA